MVHCDWLLRMRGFNYSKEVMPNLPVLPCSYVSMSVCHVMRTCRQFSRPALSRRPVWRAVPPRSYRERRLFSPCACCQDISKPLFESSVVILYFTTSVLVLQVRIVQGILKFWYVPELFREFWNSGTYQNVSENFEILVRTRIVQKILQFWSVPEMFPTNNSGIIIIVQAIQVF